MIDTGARFIRKVPLAAASNQLGFPQLTSSLLTDEPESQCKKESNTFQNLLIPFWTIGQVDSKSGLLDQWSSKFQIRSAGPMVKSISGTTVGRIKPS